MSLRKIAKEFRCDTVGPTPEDEKPLALTYGEFRVKLLAEPDGPALLSLFHRGELEICIRLGLYYQVADQEKLIVRWHDLVNHLRIVNDA
jgi:hypothetical protein